MSQSLPRSVPLVMIALLGANCPATDRVYVSSTAVPYLLEVETATGNRRSFELSDHPNIIDWEEALLDTDGTLLLETWDALQRVGIHRFNPATLGITPISGGVDGYSHELLGTGPPIEPTVIAMVRRQDRLLVLRQTTGVTEVNLTTGNRRIVSQSGEQPVGDGPPLTRPTDLVYDHRGRLLVWDDVVGLVHVDETTGTRTVLYTSGDLGMPARRLDVLPDGRLVYTTGTDDILAIWAFDFATAQVQLLSGNFGGNTAGSGPDFIFMSDLMVDANGTLWVYDAGLLALIRVGARGNRTIVSSSTMGEGEPFMSAAERPRLAPGVRPLAIDTAMGWELR